MTMSSTPAVTSALPPRTDLNGCAAMNRAARADDARAATPAAAHLPAAVMHRCARQRWLAGQEALLALWAEYSLLLSFSMVRLAECNPFRSSTRGHSAE